MAKVAVEHQFTGLTTPVAAYDSTKTNLGLRMRQANLGAGPLDKFVGPMPTAIARPQETATPIAAMTTSVIDWSATKQWVFYCDHATAAATRRIGMYEYDKVIGTYSWRGFVTLTYPTATAFTIRGFKMLRTAYSTGTVAVSGTTVTGTGTAWNTARTAVGGRIGFGSTDPTAITTWYDIAALPTDTSATLGLTAGTITAGTAFVIEGLRCVMSCTNATTTNGGLFIAKGLSFATFTNAGTAIPAATTVDNIRAVYWLKDAAVVTNTAAGGAACELTFTDTSHMCYVVDGVGATAKIFKYNLRAALTLTSGAATDAFVLATGSPAVAGNTSSHNNGRVATASHGPGSGVACLYFCTTTRVYRAVLSDITTGSITFLADNMSETPLGGTATYATMSSWLFIEYITLLDRFLVVSGSSRSYLTTYNAVSNPHERMMFSDMRQYDQSTADSGTTPGMSVTTVALTGASEGGYIHLCRAAAAQAPGTNLNQIFALAIGADWDFVGTTFDRTISPSISTPGATKLYRVLTNSIDYIGSNSAGLPAEPYRVKYRTAGITDNLGSWLDVPANGDLSGVGAVAAIQFAFEFRIAHGLCVPGRVIGFSVLYETSDDLPPELQWNLGDSNNADGTVGLVQATAFGVLPTLTITYFRADTNAAVLVQASSGTTNGVFEFWNGSAWAAGLSTNTVGMRRRFRPTAGLPSGVDVYAKIVAS